MKSLYVLLPALFLCCLCKVQCIIELFCCLIAVTRIHGTGFAHNSVQSAVNTFLTDIFSSQIRQEFPMQAPVIGTVTILHGIGALCRKKRHPAIIK